MSCGEEVFFYTYYRFIEARKMSFNIVVLAKQVPDTRNVGKDAMTPQGTVNRAALPAIFNPEDLNALELALRIKDAHPGTTIQVVTMGLPKAAEVIREGLFRGADGGVLVTDRALAGADTLATSYVLAQTIQRWVTWIGDRWTTSHRRRYSASRPSGGAEVGYRSSDVCGSC